MFRQQCMNDKFSFTRVRKTFITFYSLKMSICMLCPVFFKQAMGSDCIRILYPDCIRIWDLIVSVPEHCLSFYFTCPGLLKYKSGI